MEFKQNPYVVYVQTNKFDHIVSVNSSVFLTNLDGWIAIDSGYGNKYGHAQANYFPDSILTETGFYRYKLVNGKARECTADEMAQQKEARKPKTVAPRNITAGEYVTVNGVLYQAITNIPGGERIITGQNAIETTVEEQLAKLAKGE